MKINFSITLKDHFLSLSNANGNPSFVDYIIFFIFPISLGIMAAYLDVKIHEGAMGSLLAIASIFAALLLNVQVALFGIFQIKPKLSEDIKLTNIEKQKISDRKRVLIEVNANIAYTILVCIILCCLIFLFNLIDFSLKLTSGILVALSSHIILNIFMIVKRSYVLFSNEYKS